MPPDTTKTEDALSRFIRREVFGMPMSVIACGICALAAGCLLAMTTAHI